MHASQRGACGSSCLPAASGKHLSSNERPAPGNAPGVFAAIPTGAAAGRGEGERMPSMPRTALSYLPLRSRATCKQSPTQEDLIKTKDLYKCELADLFPQTPQSANEVKNN